MDIILAISSIGLILLLTLCFFTPYREMFYYMDFSDIVYHNEKIQTSNYDNRDLLVLHLWLCIPILNILLIVFILLFILIFILNKIDRYIFHPKDLKFWSKRDDNANEFRKMVLGVSLFFIVGPIKIVLTISDLILDKMINRK